MIKKKMYINIYTGIHICLYSMLNLKNIFFGNYFMRIKS